MSRTQHKRVSGLVYFGLTMLAIIMSGCRFPRTSSEDVSIIPAAQFVVGSSLLHSSPVAHTPQMQATLYRELRTATGMTASGALAYLDAIRNDPEKAQKLCDTMRVIITPRPDTAVHHK